MHSSTMTPLPGQRPAKVTRAMLAVAKYEVTVNILDGLSRAIMGGGLLSSMPRSRAREGGRLTCSHRPRWTRVIVLHHISHCTLYKVMLD